MGTANTKKGPDGGCEGETVRAGPTTDIPPERDGFIHVTGANRKGWTSTQHKPQYGMQDTNHATKANQRHFLRTGSDWHQTRDEQPTQDTNTTIRKRRPWEKPRRNVQASRYRDGVRKRFETRKIKKMFRRMKYRTTVPRGSSTKETWQMLLDDVDEFADTIEYVWNRFHEHQILPRQWQVAEGAQIGKQNGKKSCAAVRLINILDPGARSSLQNSGRRLAHRG